MTTKKNLAIDLDGCLADFNTGFAKILRGINPSVKLDAMSPEFPKVWDWPQAYGYLEEHEKAAWTEVENSPNFWMSLFPYASAYEDVKFLNDLQKHHDIYFLTKRFGNRAKWQTEQWLEGMSFERPTVVLCGKKGEFCEAVSVDVIIDDKPGNLLTQWTPITAVLFKRPYNVNYHNYFTRSVDSIREGLNGLV